MSLRHICFCFAISFSCCQQSPGTIFTSTIATPFPSVDIGHKSSGLAASAFACWTVSPVYPVAVICICTVSLFVRTVLFGHSSVGMNECARWVAGSQGWRSSFILPFPFGSLSIFPQGPYELAIPIANGPLENMGHVTRSIWLKKRGGGQCLWSLHWWLEQLVHVTRERT